MELIEVVGSGQHGLLRRRTLAPQSRLVHRALRTCTACHVTSHRRTISSPPSPHAIPHKSKQWAGGGGGERRMGRVTSGDGGEKREGRGGEVERDGIATAAPAHATVGLLRRHLHQTHRRRLDLLVCVVSPGR